MASPWLPNYKVFRNVVTDFGADNTGNSDASGAIQNAINGKLLSCFLFCSRTDMVKSWRKQWPKSNYKLHGNDWPACYCLSP
jgi:hypothetical protein